MTYIDNFLFNLPLVSRILIIVVLMSGISILAYKKRQLSKSGVAVAFILGGGTMYILGVAGLSVYLFFLITAAVISKLSKNIRGINKIQKKGSFRDYSQVLSNGVCALIAALIYYFTGRSEFLVVFVAVLAEACSDTWSGDIGVLSKKGPLSIISFTPVPPGQSGGVSLLGCGAGLLCSTLFGIIYFSLFNSHSLFFTFIVIASSFVGMLLDSVLGATIQVHYYDKEEDLITEKEEKNGKKLPVYRGLKFFDNDRVNLTSNIFTFLFAWGLTFIH